ncbi:sulfatase-like hydrolase/transferase [Stratiformator vulcanicus]|uniref:Arylsulfatase n=1 Tax=Stratiformator vulcanicus TaxID=2527980 RepID=A0A517R5U2_9PLAN|nr:sulfatase-like hydrolase/transferase [Stratiformator vulcanicus]QDT39276.1 Arylsulfatase precursor [Stratiformator vulcanicus]
MLRFMTKNFLLIAVIFGASAARADDRPNIVWIVAEDMSPDLGCYGDKYAATPHIDALAKRSVRYTRFFAESPMCSPSRSTIITGMHNGPLGTSRMRSYHRIPEWVRPFSAYLRDTGYYCTNNKKTDYNLARNAEGDVSEFVRAAWDDSSQAAHWRNRTDEKPFFSIFNFMGTHQSRTSRNDWDYFVDEVQSTLTSEQIHNPADAPLPPHYPQSDTARRTVARYYDCISALDDFVAKIIHQLREDGLADETIIFFYSDHGAGLPTGKACASDYGLRCPLLVHVPEQFQELAPARHGTVSDRLTCFADLAPTVLELADVDSPVYMHGIPFLGRGASKKHRYVLGTRDRMDETREVTRWISDGRYLLIRRYARDVPYDQQTMSALYNVEGELVQEIRENADEGILNPQQQHYWETNRSSRLLFDTQSDKWCLNDLANDPAQQGRIKEMDVALKHFLISERDLGFWPEAELAEAELAAPAYELARDGKGYPLERILEVTELTSFEEIANHLSDPDPAIRYWALKGLATRRDELAEIRPALTSLLDDEAASVRIEAASLLCTDAEHDDALDLLAKELNSENGWAACHAARTLERLGEKARPKLPEMKAALKNRTSGFFVQPKGPRAAPYPLEFSLISAIGQFESN